MSQCDKLLSKDKTLPSMPEHKDYLNELGLLVCGHCHSPKEQLLTLPHISDEEKTVLFGHSQKIPSPCQCLRDKYKKEAQLEQHRAAVQQSYMLRMNCFHTARDASCTFSRDDQRDMTASVAMRKYAENFPSMLESDDVYGLLVYGPVGCGKTFLAAAIANELLASGFRVEMTSITRIVNTLQDMYGGKQQYIDRLVSKDLLIIDDLGVERDSEYMQEQVTSIIDARYKSGKPLIVTTNIDLNEIKRPKNLSYRRMYDRLIEMCHPVKVIGKSRRREAVVAKYANRNSMLGIPSR